MLPGTAEGVARGLDVPYRREMLFDPDQNIRLASRYVGTLYRHYDRRGPLAIAAFNAGEARIDRYLQQGEVDLDLFVERIPIDQTRNYVRRVTTAWSRYRFLADPTRWPDIDLPARVGP